MPWQRVQRKGRFIPRPEHVNVLDTAKKLLQAKIFTGQTGYKECTVWPEANKGLLFILMRRTWVEVARGLATNNEDWPHGVQREIPDDECRKVRRYCKGFTRS